MLLDVAVHTPLRRLLTYEFDQSLPRGVRVRVPFRSRSVIGFVWGDSKKPAPLGLKAIVEALDKEPLFDERTLDFYGKAAFYYGISLGDLLASSFPKNIREGKPPLAVLSKHFIPNLFELSESQARVASSIELYKGYASHLIQGETGSGKTEIYLKLFESILTNNGQALFLVPEISLTPQFEDRLAIRLGARVTIFHSKMKESAREEAFSRALSGSADVFLGARSALFLPFKNLQLMVVDEEHDGSYKQSERGTYHARDLAILRAKVFNIPIVLGSATPSLESLTRGNQTIHRLKKFYAEEVKPAIEVVDLKKIWAEEGRTFISDKLHQALSDNLEKKEQSLLFLNRRGTAAHRVCTSCGTADDCPRCTISMTLHADIRQLICHWCGYQTVLTHTCRTCGSKEFFTGSIGTKEVETQIQARFPDARVARLDRDQVQTRANLGKMLRDFADGKIDILVGTQMIAKGIDIPKLSLMGMILADLGWSVPDYRANERAFQLLLQLMGRVGRRGQKSKVILQTLRPESPLFNWIRMPEPFDAFAESELAIRKMADLPPYSKMALITVKHRNEKSLSNYVSVFAPRLKKLGSALGIEVIGPVPAPLFRWKNQFRQQVLIKSTPKGHMTAFLTAVLDDLDSDPLKKTLAKGIQIKVDRDPYHFI